MSLPNFHISSYYTFPFSVRMAYPQDLLNKSDKVRRALIDIVIIIIIELVVIPSTLQLTIIRTCVYLLHIIQVQTANVIRITLL